MAREFGGIWPALLTPLDGAGRPNLAAVEALADRMVCEGLDGLYILGSTGQGLLLDLESRRQVAERVVRTVAGRIPVMVHVGALATDDAIALARHAETIGADAVSSVATIYYAVGPAGLIEHYRRIGAATPLPLFVYHYSGVDPGYFRAHEYAERVLELPNIAGMKITDPDLYQFGLIASYSRGRLRLFSGADELMCQAAISGAVGAIGTFYNLWGPVCRAVRRAFVGGAVELATRFMAAFQLAIDEVIRSGGTWSFLEAAMSRKYGIKIGAPRPPLGTIGKVWTEDEAEAVTRRVEAAGNPAAK